MNKDESLSTDQKVDRIDTVLFGFSGDIGFIAEQRKANEEFREALGDILDRASGFVTFGKLEERMNRHRAQQSEVQGAVSTHKADAMSKAVLLVGILSLLASAALDVLTYAALHPHGIGALVGAFPHVF